MIGQEEPTVSFWDQVVNLVRQYPFQVITLALASMAIVVNIRSTNSLLQALKAKRSSRIRRNPSLYEDFHGAAPKGTRKVHVKEPKRLVKIGRLKSLVYQPDNPSKRKGTNFEHRFGDYGYKFKRGQEPILAVSDDGKQLFIVEGKYEFDERGIVG